MFSENSSLMKKISILLSRTDSGKIYTLTISKGSGPREKTCQDGILELHTSCWPDRSKDRIAARLNARCSESKSNMKQTGL